MNVAQRGGAVKNGEKKVFADPGICVSQHLLQNHLLNSLCLPHFLLCHPPFLPPDLRFGKGNAPACPKRTLWKILRGSGPVAGNYGHSDSQLPKLGSAAEVVAEMPGAGCGTPLLQLHWLLPLKLAD